MTTKNTKAANKANSTKEVQTITSADVGTVPATVVVENKATKARAVFVEMFAMEPRPARKEMIARAKAEAGLTDAGAATYLQNYKKANGLTKTTVETPAAE